MPRPQVSVVVATALPRRGAVTDTGLAMLLFSDTANTSDQIPHRITSQAEALALYGNTATGTTFAQYVSDCLTQGAPAVVVLRVAAATATPTQPEWQAGLNQLTEDFGIVAQVAIPGVSTTAAQAALAQHATDFPCRTVFLDGAPNANASALTAIASAYAVATGAPRIAVGSSWLTMPTPGTPNTTRDIPSSVVMAGLAARGDAARGHANNQPCGDQNRGAGFVIGGIAPKTLFTNADLDTLHDGGVCGFRLINGRPVLMGWRSVSSATSWKQLNWGRVTAQLIYICRLVADQFLFRQIDGQGQVFAELEGGLRGVLQPLYVAGALYGARAEDAYDVAVATVNTLPNIQAGEMRSAISVAYTPAAEKVTVNLTTSVAAGV